MSTSTVPPPTTAPTEPEAAASLAERWPVVAQLPRDTPRWRVDYQVIEGQQLVLRVTLRATLNRPEQLDAYRADLAAAKAEVLAWLGNVGVDGVQLAWSPPEAASL